MSEDDQQSVVQLANAVAAEHDAAIIVYSGGIDQDGFGKLLAELQPTDTKPLRKNVVLLLTTNGGLANEAYQMARALQHGFDCFKLVVPQYCKSAGTLIALGAHELVMDPIAELGPLDVQIYQRDEIGQRRSGLLIKTAFEGMRDETLDVFEKIMLGIKHNSSGSISFDTASRIASSLAAQVMAPVYAQVSPEALGNDLRDLHVATHYGLRLIEEGKNASSNSVHHLVNNYPSHDFIIDMKETSELFRTVSQLDVNLTRLCQSLGNIVYVSQPNKLVLRLDEDLGESDGNEDATKAESSPQVSDLADGREDPRESDPTGSETGNGNSESSEPKRRRAAKPKKG